MIIDYSLISTSMIVLLKYLLDNKGRLWAPAYHKRGSPLHALVETVNECGDGGDPPTSSLLGDALREFTPYNVFMKALSVRDGYIIRRQDLIRLAPQLGLDLVHNRDIDSLEKSRRRLFAGDMLNDKYSTVVARALQ